MTSEMIWHDGPPASTRSRVLVVDDDDANRRLLTRLLSADGHEVSACANGREAVEAMSLLHPDVVLMDVRMPVCDGFTACREIKRDPATRLTPIVLMTGSTERQDRIEAIEAGADDFLTKPIDSQELKARVRSLIRLKHYTDEMDSAEAVIFSLALTIEARDAYTDGHCHRLADYAVALGRELHLSQEELAALHRGGYLHDLGKVGIPDAILLKPGRLTRAEFEKMKEHPVIGDRLCGNLRILRNVRPIVRHHHERLDGSGYPDGLRGDAVPLLAQVVGVVDVYDALTTRRAYRPAMSPERAYDELLKDVRRGWRRADLVEAFGRVHAAAADRADRADEIADPRSAAS